MEGVGSPKVRLGEVHVHLHRGEIGMAQEGGDRDQVGAALDHVGGRAMRRMAFSYLTGPPPDPPFAASRDTIGTQSGTRPA